MSKFCALSFVVLLPVSGLLAGDPLADIREQVPQVASRLTEFHGALPGNISRKLHIVYWTPSDREPQPQWRERLSRTFETVAGFYEGELKRLGLAARRLPLDHAADGLVNIHLVKGAEPYAHYNVDSGAEIRGECLPVLRAAGISAERETIVIFCNMSVWDPEKRTMRQNSPYYAGGTARSGTAWQVDSPLLDPQLLTEKGQHIQDGQYGRISLGRYNSIFVGGVIHELGHALGLPHNRERPDEAALFGTALMGSGNRTYGENLRGEGKGSFLTLTHGLRLASHPLFTGSDKALAEKAAGDFADLAVRTEGKSIEVTGRITGSPQVYAMVGYSDPAGGNDYDATTASTVPDSEGRFTLHFDALQSGKAGELRLVACHVNGLTTQRGGLGYDVAANGDIDIAPLQARLLLDPVVPRLKGTETSAVLATLPPAEQSNGARLARAIVTRLSSSESQSNLTPADISADVKQISLCDTRASAQSVGFGQPVTDRLPEPPYFLAAGGQLFERGLYAHSPARHAFALGGKWSRLTGTCGIADGRYGKVAFVIKADGRELWRSRKAERGSLERYDVSVKDTAELELVVEDGGDSNRGDWALWLNPALTR
ncbi:NPCBM/NEW2 domain-containing protein [Verrucomicrobiota bacterium sgz303538]